jgi:Hemerythrin HHE cation binding domain
MDCFYSFLGNLKREASLSQKSSSEDIALIKSLDVVDMILLDHVFLKDCIRVLSDEKHDKKKKFSTSKKFLDSLKLHSAAEKKAVYGPLEANEELHFMILEGEIEHGIVDQKVKLMRNRLSHSRTLSDENEMEMKVLAELVHHHIKEEESELLPKMKEEIDDASLIEIGAEFMKIRKFEPSELTQYPALYDELIQWKDSVQKISSQFLTKMDKYVENLKH